MSINFLNSNGKVTAGHLKKTAYLYIRQSTLRQVFENTESTQRQYALRQRAVVLGWPAERIEIIDCDQGQSGASTGEREGFQKLVAEVGLGKAGIVMGLEVSRLARNCADWHRLLEICALSGTLILDEDGLYDPAYFNDRLLLGLKGTMSEAELHVLKARLRGGILSKAQRGELKMPLPVGLVYDPLQRIVLDPDKQVQNTLRHFFETFCRTGAGWATVQAIWNDKLRQLEQAHQEYEKQRQNAQLAISQEQKAQILALAEDFPRLWRDPATSDRDRKRMARLMLEDVTLKRDQTLITVQVRFKGGATKVLSLPMPPTGGELRKTKVEIVAEIDRLLERWTDSEIATELNSKGWRSSANLPFNARMIRSLSTSHKLPSRSERLRAKGLLTASQIAELIGSKPLLVDYWRAVGLLNGIRLNDKNEYLYEHPNANTIQQIKRRIKLRKPTTYPG
jgi:DNA invertase Pin-like site-specific DNA recombinase